MIPAARLRRAAASPVSGTACAGCTIDIYSDGADEGRAYEGSTTADAGGSFKFDRKLAGPFVTATATDGQGNTSPFSQALPLFGH